ncbi:MAG: hypothetical protein GFH27_549287n143 [Chloroflexi bacterium AL-W]|nr:hypothetical protein [Chloroflexi bacterium AL-N1]NOK66417.1 hypothetical protein [Chloroflexi bacterium AL-N10]NOK71805.1 hypothetical protein [Chloroflexi bacterium AL-N5]NOK81062.1 hypothetical protein [Chloroflexi bacterium AL-W]NOK89335.1 hypothetical protein [Chloroflexi bacterium AL-N15]
MLTPIESPFKKLLFFLQRLDDAKLRYKSDHVRDAIMISVTVPDERWEVEFFEDGLIEVERFISTGTMENEDMIERLFIRFGDN